MEPIILDSIPVQLELAPLMKRLRIRDGSPQAAELQALLEEASAVARPRAMCGVAFIDERGDDYVVLDGVRFSSRIMAVNLQQVQRVFPFVATCGSELEVWANGLDDMVLSFWSEAIREQALAVASRAASEHLDQRYEPGRTACMNPGSLPDWPLREQRPLFMLLGDPTAQIGVQLTPSLLMLPTKSVSGIRFATEQAYENCQLCPREDCPGRRAVYDADKFDREYRREPAS